MDEGELLLQEPRNEMTPHRLYDLSRDVGESEDLSKREPERVAEMLAAWEAWNAGLPPARAVVGPGRSADDVSRATAREP